MKRKGSLFLTVLGFFIVFVIGLDYYSPSVFVINNLSGEKIQSVSFKWRNQSKEIHEIAPGEVKTVRIRGEAAMKILVTFEGGRQVKEEDGLYFSSFIKISVRIFPNAIKMEYLWGFTQYIKCRYPNHICNDCDKSLSFLHGMYSATFPLTEMEDFDTLSSSMFLS
jgi:hypothetical protein